MKVPTLRKTRARASALYGLPRHSSASPRKISLPRRNITSPKHTCKSCFDSFLLLILTIIHWINENLNK